MEKKYIKPSIKVKKIEMENLLGAASPGALNSETPINGLDNRPGNGGDSDGSQPVNSKFNAWDSWTTGED